MNEMHPIETRRRSRSKTPLLRSQYVLEDCEQADDEDHHYDHKKKAATAAVPKVQTITEETVEVTSSSSASSNAKEVNPEMKTSDYFSEDISPVNNKTNSKATLQSHQKKSSATFITATTTTTSSTTLITKSKKVESMENNLAAATSTPKANYAVDSFAAQFASSPGASLSTYKESAAAPPLTQARRSLNEVTQNEMNAEFERSQQQHEESVANKSINASNTFNSGTHNKNNNRSFSRFFSRSFGSGRGGSSVAESNTSNVTSQSDHLAYQEYKRAGEYWKNTPKTDYTYSELSPHRRELAPGVVAMPNMSRRSLENHHDRIHYMVQRNPTQESYIRRRYESPRYAKNRRETAKLIYDSGDEIDLTQYDDYGKSHFVTTADTHESWFMRSITTVVTTVTNIWEAVFGGLTPDEHSTSRRTGITSQKKGFFGSIAHGISSAFSGFFRCLYFFITYILSVDTWLLQSRNADRNGKKRFLILLLILLPLLLLGAWYLLDESERLTQLQSSQALLPITLLGSISSALSYTGAAIRDLFGGTAVKTTLSGQPKISPEVANLYNIQRGMQKLLTVEESRGILHHIEKYMQQLLDLKLNRMKQRQAQADSHISPDMALSILNVVRAQIKDLQQKGELRRDMSTLNAREVRLIAEQVQQKLQASGTSAGVQMPLTQDNLNQIQQLIEQHIELNQQQVDMDSLLQSILTSPQLAEFIDSTVTKAIDDKMQATAADSADTAQFDQQQLLIDELSKEIAFIKLTLSDKLSENEKLQRSISNLQLGQDDLLQRLQEYELAMDQRLSGLLTEVERRLATLKDQQFSLLNKQIKLSLVEILGLKHTLDKNAPLNDTHLQNWVRSMFVAKEYLEQRLLEINGRTNDKIRQELDRSGMLIMRQISERLKQDILLAIEAKHNESNAIVKEQINSGLSEAEVKKLVKEVLAVYDADKTGLVDFALESAGGQILSTRCTENYQTKTAQISIFGIPLWYPTNTPRVAISPNVQPGECWAFQGFPGFLVLKLNTLVYVTGFTLEHIPKSLSPNGLIESAPRSFAVWGLQHEKDQDPVLFGEYEYADNDASLQYFPVQNHEIKRPHEIVELRIESNHGNQAYTCLYRFRVHGKPPVI